MPITAATAQERTVEIVIQNQRGCLQDPNKRRKVFGAGEDLCHAFFEKHGVWGKFHLTPLRAIKGCKERQGVHIGILDADKNQFKLTLQPGSNDTAWDYYVRPPEGTSASDIYEKLTSAKEVVQKSYTAEELQVQPETLQLGPELELPEPPEPVISLEPSETRQAAPIDPVKFVADLDLVAVALFDLFPERDSAPRVGEFIEILMDNMSWMPQLAQQAFQALMNNCHVEMRLIHDEQRVVLTGKRLKESFTKLGVHQPKPQTRPAPASQVIPPKVEPPANVPPASNVRQLRPAQPSEVEAPPVSQPIENTSSVSVRLEDLERLADEHGRARQAIVNLSAQRIAFEEYRARLKAKLEEADASIARIDKRRAAAFAILSSERHMHASTKYAQIQSILES